jgi:diguanylate cyclase (GGDEF)-like protein
MALPPGSQAQLIPHFCMDGTIEVNLGASIGVTLFPSDSSEPDILLRHADYAMYQAKKSGRNQICFCAEANNN